MEEVHTDLNIGGNFHELLPLLLNLLAFGGGFSEHAIGALQFICRINVVVRRAGVCGTCGIEGSVKLAVVMLIQNDFHQAGVAERETRQRVPLEYVLGMGITECTGCADKPFQRVTEARHETCTNGEKIRLRGRVGPGRWSTYEIGAMSTGPITIWYTIQRGLRCGTMRSAG